MPVSGGQPARARLSSTLAFAELACNTGPLALCLEGDFAMNAGNALSQSARRSVAAFAFVLCASAETSAQQPSQGQISAVRSACRSDYMAHCASVPPGGKAALACLQKNVASLSPSCQSAVNAVSAGAAAPAATEQQPTAPAAETPAQPAQPAPTTAPPSAAAGTHPSMSPREEMMVLRGSCGPDYHALCSGAPPGGGRVIDCLRANRASLSPQCRHTLSGAAWRR